MDIKQAFAELGLTQQASPAEAKAAYRTLAMLWHPDVNNGTRTDDRMKAINVAYALVCQHLEVRESTTPPTGFAEFDCKAGFGVGSRAKATPRAECAQRTLRVSLFEAAFGCIKRISGSTLDSCTRCAGSGELPGTWTVGSKCLKCFGHGILDARGVNGGGRTTCDACLGSGVFKPAAPQCPACKGTGKAEHRAWVVDVRIYAGTLDGTLVQTGDIRVRSGVQGLPHSFKLTVQIEKHPLFRLDQNRLSVTVPISVWRWALGGAITVPTLDGSARVSLPNKLGAILVKDQGWPEYKTPQLRRPLFVVPKIIHAQPLRHEERRMLELLDVRSNLPEVRGWERSVQAWMESSDQDLG